MISLWPATITSLNDSLAALYGAVGQLKAAQSINIAEVIEQLETAAESSRNLRSLVLAEMPEASWRSREELDAILEEIQRRVDARIQEQKNLELRRSRLIALAKELECGRIAHRRPFRVEQLDELRDQAVKELCSQAGPDVPPPPLPGPDAEQWIEWAFGLKEPEDTESLEALRNRFPYLDEFIANLEPKMWTVESAVLA